MSPARHSHTAPPPLEFVAIERDSDRSTNAVRRWTLVERTWRVVYVGAWTFIADGDVLFVAPVEWEEA